MKLEMMRLAYSNMKANREIAIRRGDAALLAQVDASMAELKRTYRAQKNRNLWRREKDAALRSCGLVRVVGAQGGVYWE